MKFLIYISVVVIFASCGRGSRINGNEKANQLQSAQEKPIHFIERFVNWYEKSYPNLNSLEVIKKNSQGNYTIDSVMVSRYIVKLNESGYFDGSYLENLKAHFKLCEKRYIQEPQNDGPPWGLSYDLILLTQDVGSVFAKKNSITLIHQTETSDGYKIGVEMDMRLEFELRRYADGWKISRIVNLGL